MGDRGRINSEVLSPFGNYRGVNKIAHTAGFVAWRLERIQAQEAAKKNYGLSDEIRELVTELRKATGYLGVEHTPPKEASQ